MSDTREFDLVIWGASGFTGRLVAEYLFEKYGVNQELKWAMAGRNAEKLEKVRAEVADSSVPLIIADSLDEASLGEMASKTKVICTTVGPYGKYGSKLVDACVAHKTHYCDLAGEVLFIRESVDKHHEQAKADGTKIVHSCGYDSIPSDMGVYFIQKEAKASKGSPAKAIKMRVKDSSGSLSGGTYASMMDTMEQAAKDQSLFFKLINPYGLNPEGKQSGPDKADLREVLFEEETQSWIYPFIMASINTRIVRRSHALIDFAYGEDFEYSEANMAGEGDEGKAKAMKEAGIMAAIMARPGTPQQEAMAKRMPKPGEGPSKEQREAGYYDWRFFITHDDGTKSVAKVTGDRDPGYGSTSKMLAECGVCLAKDQTPDTAGVLTPSTAMGDLLLGRLIANAGLTFSIEE
ncbi:MAG: saccharopine dehydrogenase NADP-binding domain-containing protein [Bacteroidia bacterium]|nr:saccharopine dehydrogenase NADP-binding domain-containing protein [Bacteroidia bacterium]